MKHRVFLRLLSFRERWLFFIGTFVDRWGQRIGYSRLRKFRNMMAVAEEKNFQYFYENDFLVFQKENIKLLLRRKGSDYDVFNQVFIKDEYSPIIKYIIDNKIRIETIVDAGSNIGLTAIKLISFFPSARIICLEPDPHNYQQLSLNISHYKDKVLALPYALWNKEEDLFIDFGFRDGKDWSRSVTNKKGISNVAIKGISMNTLINQYKLDSIDLLKIDIEGSEATIFSRDSDLSFLNKIRILVIEIHDEFKCRNDIYDILHSRNYRIFNADEITIAIAVDASI